MADEGDELALARLRTQFWRRPLWIGDAEKLEEKGQKLPEALVEENQLAGDLSAGFVVAVALGDPEDVPQQLEEGQVRNGLAVRGA